MLSKLIAFISPKWALRRAQSSAILAYYESANVSRLHKTRTDNSSPDETVKDAASVLRAQARHLDENYDVASGALDILVNNIVGTGIAPDPSVRTAGGELATELNNELRVLWEDFIKTPEVTKQQHYYQSQRTMARTWLRDGEMFIHYVEGAVKGLDHETKVKLSLELLEADMVPSDYEDLGKNIVQGIRKNNWGQPKEYFVYKQHPGDALRFFNEADVISIKADNIGHLKHAKRIRQTRGVSKFAPVLQRFDDTKEIEESERVAARVSAAMTGMIQKGSPDMYIAPTATEGAYRDMEMSPGMIFDDLAPGESIGTMVSNRPNSNVIEFVDGNLRRAASGLGTSYSSLSKDYNGSFSSQRQELVESHMNYSCLWHEYKEMEARPTYERFVKMAVSQGLVAVATDIDPDTLYDADFSKPVIPWVDPVKEMKALEIELALNLNSKSSAIRARGRNPEEVRKRIKEEQDEEKALGIDKAPPAPVEGPPKDEKPEDEDPEDGNNKPDDEDDEIKEGSYAQAADGSLIRMVNGRFQRIEVKEAS